VIKFSKSRFELQQTCLGKYWWKYVQATPADETVWPATIIGEVVHLYLENFFNAFIVSPEDWKEIRENLHKWNLEKLEKKYNLTDIVTLFTSQFKDYKKDLVAINEDGSKRIFKRNRGWKDEEFFKKYPKWLWEIVKFFFRCFETLKQNTASEYEFEIQKQVLDQTVLVRGVIDLITDTDIIDFKTVKDSSHYYFIDWKNDPQSLVYLFAYKNVFKKPPKSFGYFTFNENERTIIISQVDYPKDVSEYENCFEKLLEVFVNNHKMSADQTLWNPEKTNCFFCAHKNVCSRAVKEK
jgi:hypothetical protein